MTPPKLTAYLSGAENGTTDFPLPLVTFGLSKRSGTPSYYRISTPAFAATLEAFYERPNGKLHIQADGAAWEQFNVNAFTFAIGASSATAQASGERQATNSSPAAHTLTAPQVSDEAQGRDGRRRLSISPDLAIRAGDTVTWQGTAYTVALVTFSVNADHFDQSLTLEEITP